MKFKFFLISIILFAVISCKKDGGKGLSISIASVSEDVVPVNSATTVTLNFNDNGGNVIDTVYLIKNRINQDSAEVAAAGGLVRPVVALYPPTYPGSAKGQIQLILDNTLILATAFTPPQIGTPPANESDSLILKFVAIDAANNKSDTISSGLIIVQR